MLLLLSSQKVAECKVFRALFSLKVNNPGVIPPFAKAIIWSGMRATSRFRAEPNFLIIGGQKCGTTSLYSYLSSHPQVLLSLKKEPSYFGDNFHLGEDWYRAHFPLQLSVGAAGRASDREVLVGEASTASLFHPSAAEQAFVTNPNFKVIVMTREPVARAISHYFFYLNKGLESRPIEEAFGMALDSFEEDLTKWLDWRGSIEALESKIDTYLIRGLYDKQLLPWEKYFGQDGILRIKSEEFSSQSGVELDRVSSFLGVETLPTESSRRFNKGSYQQVPEELVGKLRGFYDEKVGPY